MGVSLHARVMVHRPLPRFGLRQRWGEVDVGCDECFFCFVLGENVGVCVAGGDHVGLLPSREGRGPAPQLGVFHALVKREVHGTPKGQR